MSIYLTIIPIVYIIITYNFNYFRSIHCLTLSLFSLHNTLKYKNITDFDNNTFFENQNEFKMISFYSLLYLAVDLIRLYLTKQLRNDLLLHHFIVFIWICHNLNTGITSFCLLCEVLTCAYFLDIKYQPLFRILCIIIIRYPVWLITAFSNYCMPGSFNFFVLNFMMILDSYWLYANIKNYLIKIA